MEFRCKRSPRFDCALSWNIPRIYYRKYACYFQDIFRVRFSRSCKWRFCAIKSCPLAIAGRRLLHYNIGRSWYNEPIWNISSWADQIWAGRFCPERRIYVYVLLFSVFLYRYRGNRSGICGYGDVYRPDILQKRYQTENGCSEKLTVSQRVSRKFPENLARNVSVKPPRV